MRKDFSGFLTSAFWKKDFFQKPVFSRPNLGMMGLAGVGLVVLGWGLPLMVQAGTQPGAPIAPSANLTEPQPLSLTTALPVAQKPPAKPPSRTDIAKMDPKSLANYQSYRTVIQQTLAMVSDGTAQRLAQKVGLNILNVTWEDTGRYQNSAVGPNISDMTIQVQQFNPRSQQYELSLMPVIRHPNFADESADVPLDRFFLWVGNERGKDLRRVSLKDFLGNVREYLHQPNSWKGYRTSLLAERDTHALVSAQACFLPIPQGDRAEFNPVLFNYQSSAGNPAVLTILATREGTSVTIIDNQRDGFEAGRTWGQRLFFNKQGQRASLTGQRLSDFQAGTDRPTSASGVTAAGESGLNLVLLIQVPLKQKIVPNRPMEAAGAAVPQAAPLMERSRNSDVEAAVIGHGRVEGPFTEIDDLEIQRDPRFPVRVTVQFYKATSNGVVAESDLVDIRKQIARVYADADYVGSLVTQGTKGRPTEYDGSKQEPPGWWQDFWTRYEQNTGQSSQDALAMLRRLRGETWMPRSPEELKDELRRSQPQYRRRIQ